MNYGMRIMALKARNKAPTVKIQAAPVLAMAFFEQKGLTELIDSRFDLDKRIKLTPGNAVKAMVGQMMSIIASNVLKTNIKKKTQIIAMKV